MNQERLELILATKNVHKIRELKEMLRPLPHLDLRSLLDFPRLAPPQEKGSSFLENATQKALYAANELNALAIGDDSGLIVPALEGDPGLFSSRYAGDDATDKDNRKKLLEKMKKLSEQQRNAYFICTLVLASPEGVVKSVSATCEGKIIDEERGGSGFAYDPLFIKHEYSKTFAELGDAIKNQISHRGKAVDKLLITLETLFAKSNFQK